MENSDQVATLQRLLGLGDDGVYGPGTRAAHLTENETRGLATDTLPYPPVAITPVNVAMVAPGSNYTVRGTGFAPGTTANVTLFSTPTHLGTTTVNSDGSVNATVVIPADTPVGEHTLELSGESFTGGDAIVSTPVTIGIDTELPWVSSVVASPSSVDITSGPATITVEITAGDTGTGVYAGGAHYSCNGGSMENPPFGGGMFWNDGGNSPGWNGQLVSGTVNNGIWRGTFEVPAGIPACTLTLHTIDICDAAHAMCLSGTPESFGITNSAVTITRSD